MPRKRNKVRTATLIMLCIIAFTLVRQFEGVLFYDPFLDFFRDEFAGRPLPDFDALRLIAGLTFRYLLNTVISLAILYILFRSKEQLKFASFLYVFFFIVLLAAFFICLSAFGNTQLTALFYIRRFLIQPILLLLFLPAFYYQEKRLF